MLYKRGGSLDLRLADGMSFKTHIQLFDAETTYEILLGMDFMEENCVNSGFYRAQEGPRKEIELGGRRFIHDPSFYIGHYSEIDRNFEREEPELYNRKDKSSTSNSLSSSQETLLQIEKAHLMDPGMVPDLLWKQGNLYNPQSDEVSLILFPNLPEDAILIDEIPGFTQGKENDIGSMLLEKVKRCDIDLLWSVFIRTISYRESKDFLKLLYSNFE